MTARLVFAVCTLGLAGCGDDGGGGKKDSGPPLGDPIVAPPQTWTWVDFPDSACDDGSTTGIGIDPSATSTDVLLYFAGGGACWDYQTCYVLNTAVHGPFGSAQLAALVAAGVPGSAFDRTVPTNRFKDWNYVFVPYCTGDLHAGDRVATYTSGSTTRTYHHVGHANAIAYLRRLGATFTAPGKLVVSGSSAGGGGAVYNYPSFRQYWPTQALYLIDDSLPMFEGDDVSPAFRNVTYDAWNLGEVLEPLCGPDCRNDSSLVTTKLAAAYPADRMALLSSLQDQTVRSYDQLTGPQFEAALRRMLADVIDPLANVRYFIIPGESHTMLGAPASSVYTSNGIQLVPWLAQMVDDDPAWASTK